jgi:hypothetical protein
MILGLGVLFGDRVFAQHVQGPEFNPQHHKINHHNE